MAKPKKTVYISGTWDLFHVGHLRILDRARALGDTLIVGVNSDEYVKVLDKKTVFNFRQRSEIVAMIKGVSWVVPHKSADDFSAFETWNIKIRVVGQDWGEVGGQDKAKKLMRKGGIKLVRLKRTKGISTSAIKRAIKNESFC